MKRDIKMKKIISAILSIGNDLYVKIEIKSNKKTRLFAFYVNKKPIAISGALSEIKIMFNSWFYATEEIRQIAVKTLEG